MAFIENLTIITEQLISKSFLSKDNDCYIIWSCWHNLQFFIWFILNLYGLYSSCLLISSTGYTFGIVQIKLVGSLGIVLLEIPVKFDIFTINVCMFWALIHLLYSWFRYSRASHWTFFGPKKSPFTSKDCSTIYLVQDLQNPFSWEVFTSLCSKIRSVEESLDPIDIRSAERPVQLEVVQFEALL